jgi:hypothetical protein
MIFGAQEPYFGFLYGNGEGSLALSWFGQNSVV